jgi:hypothetical protein
MQFVQAMTASLGVAAALVVGSPGAAAQTPAIPQVVAANGTNTKATCTAVRPIVAKSPSAAAEIVTAATANPALTCGLAECLSSIQRGMKKSNPAGAKEVSEIVSTAPPAFKSCYALALAPSGPGAGGGAGQPGAVADAGTDAGNGGSGSGPGGSAGGFGAGFGSFGGTAGGSLVSPFRP